jgi:hypothetical protein
MISKGLYNEVLIKPVNLDVNTLNIVSGYATAAMAFHHISELIEYKPTIKINLVLGMCIKDGLSQSNHKGFQKLMDQDFPTNFECNYLTELPQVHSKIYIWSNNTKPIVAYLGSANYTQTAFLNSQREIMSLCDPKNGYDYFMDLNSQSIYCNHIDAENYVTIYKDSLYRRIRKIESQIQEIDSTPDIIGLPSVHISLLDNFGNLPSRSGLNWGQRPEYHRNPNQAYIRLPANITHSDFFPKLGIHFTILTDDNKVLICSRAQDNGKAIHTPQNNSLIGEYFRNRLNLAYGEPIKKEDLLKYGRDNIDVYKIDDETYFLDFSIPQSG